MTDQDQGVNHENGAVAVPYYADEFVTLYHGKYEDVVPAIGFPKVDLIVADPPYAETSLAWDRWPDGWPVNLADLSSRLWCFGSMRMFLDRRDEFSSWRYSQELIWEKHNGSNLAADRFARVHEHATYWYRGPWADAHEDVPTTPDATARAVRRKDRPSQWIGATGANTYESHDGGPRLMRSVQYVRSMHGRAINETQKPVPLLESLIRYGCPSGGLVLDPFAGSTSTLIAARNLGCRAIGIERRESQCEKAAQWLSAGVLDFAGSVSNV